MSGCKTKIHRTHLCTFIATSKASTYSIATQIYEQIKKKAKKLNAKILINRQIDVTNVMNALSKFQMDFLETPEQSSTKRTPFEAFLSLEQAH